VLRGGPPFSPAGVFALPGLAPDQCAFVGFTSGSTGPPTPHAKLWSFLSGSTAQNARRILETIAPAPGGSRPWIVATVPPQHMYGMEMSVLLPLLGDMSVHCGRPLFPADVAAALAEVPAPRVLVTTPVHLRALVESGLEFPDLALVISATAPLETSLAVRAERRLRARVLDVLGSTETCAIATREGAREAAWRPHSGVVLTPGPAGTLVEAPWFDKPALLQDIVEFLPGGCFTLRGRNADSIEIAGKRASLAELTQRLLAVSGVSDAIVFQPEAADLGLALRVSALAVAPGLTAASILERLRESVDPAFLPRPLVLVAALPRNALGKLPREQLLGALRAAAAGVPCDTLIASKESPNTKA
jgi:acyl-coenzyme A synthetase/AMP-(fatty) acid ligase